MAYRVYGRVRRSDNGQGISNLTVRAYDVDWISSDDFLGSDVTDAVGGFDISFDEEDFDAGWFDPEGGPDIIVRLWNSGGRLIHQTSERSGAGATTYLDIRLNPLDLLGEYTVSGRVRDGRSGRSLCDLNVEAWDDDFIWDDRLGADRTDINGAYLIPYERADFEGLFEGDPDPFVKVRNDAGRELTRSSTRSGAPPHTVIDLAIGAVEVSRSVSECVYGWTAAYRQEGTHIVVRIQLNPDDDVTDAEVATLRNLWETGIQNKWSSHFACCCESGAKTTADSNNWRSLTFDVQFVTTSPHHTVRIRRGPMRTNMTTWDTSDTGDVASHEFGHMLGLPDEYADANCPNRSPVNTATVMDDNTEVIERQVEHLCQLLNENAVPISRLIFPFPDLIAGWAITRAERIPAMQYRIGGDPEMGDEPDMKQRREVRRVIHDVARAKREPSGKDRIVHVVSGGAPGERFESRLEVRGNGSVDLHLLDEPAGIDERATTALDTQDLQHLYGELEASQILVMEEAGRRFLPDSLVGTITIEVGGKETTFYYLADEEERRDQASPMRPQIASVKAALDRIAGRAQRRNEELQERLAERLKPERGEETTRRTSAPDELESLSELHGKGVLSDEEFEAARRRLLSDENGEDSEG